MMLEGCTLTSAFNAVCVSSRERDVSKCSDIHQFVVPFVFAPFLSSFLHFSLPVFLLCPFCPSSLPPLSNLLLLLDPFLLSHLPLSLFQSLFPYTQRPPIPWALV
jgi:hypothetical protein